MKKHRKSKKYLEELRKVPIVSVSCEKVGVSRNTVYRWRKEDSDFKEKMDEALEMGVDSVNDMAESKVILAIQGGKEWATKFWLKNRHKSYITPRPNNFWDAFKKETTIQGFKVIVHHTDNNKGILKKKELFDDES